MVWDEPETYPISLDPHRFSAPSTAPTVGSSVFSTGQPSQNGGVLSTAAHGPHQLRRDSGVWLYQNHAGPSSNYFFPPPAYIGYYRDTAPKPISTRDTEDDSQHRARLQWQRPYIGPLPESSLPHETQPTSNPSSAGVSSGITQGNIPVVSGSQVSPSPSAMTEPVGLKNLSSLSDLPPGHIAEILRNNPELRDAVWAVVDQQRKSSQ